MFEINYKSFSSFVSFLLHSLFLFLFYFITANPPQTSRDLIEFSIASGSGGTGGQASTQKEEIKKSVEEEIVKATKENAAIKPGKQNQSIDGNTSGTGTGYGTGTGTGQPGIIQSPKPIVEDVFLVAVDEMPEPIGGMQKILSQVNYPADAKRNGINGTVFVLAYIDENGSVRKTFLTKGIGGGCDEAAMRAVSFSRFKPGKHKGQYVKVQMQIPIQFNFN